MKYDKFWYAFAFAVWLLVVYLAVSNKPIQVNETQPSEFEMRGGNYWK